LVVAIGVLAGAMMVPAYNCYKNNAKTSSFTRRELTI